MTPRPIKRWTMLTRLFRTRASEIAAAEAETEAAMSEMRAERDRHLAAARRSLEATIENLRELRARVPGAAHS